MYLLVQLGDTVGVADDPIAGVGCSIGARMYDSFTERRVYVGRATLIAFAMFALAIVHRLV